jgi:RimJ/RimL family protein N-acetyltransferase
MGEDEMNKELYRGNLVRLSAEDPQAMGEAFSRWNRDSEYFRLLDTDPPHLWSNKKFKEWIEKEIDKDLPTNVLFGIRVVLPGPATDPAGDKLIGFVSFDGINWASGDTFVAIAMGEREYRGRGYGTEAMQLMLRYGFSELNLHRVSLCVFDYNPRAIRSYEKCGFRHEGRMREIIQRDGEWHDLIFMGILREEWEKGSDI